MKKITIHIHTCWPAVSAVGLFTIRLNGTAILKYFILFILFCLSAESAEIYVHSKAINGNGTKAKPYSLKSGIKQLNKAGGKLIIQKGSYQVNGTINITAHNASIKAEQGAILVAGKTIPFSKFSNNLPAEYRSRIHPNAKGKVRFINLQDLGIPIFKEWPGFIDNRGHIFELLHGGQRLQIARWPNHQAATMKKVLHNGDKAKKLGGVFEYSDESHEKWPVEKGIWLRGYWRVPWVLQMLKVKSINKEKNTITFQDAVGMGIGSKYHRPYGSGKEPYWVENQIEEIDLPGEWAFDFKKQVLLIYLPENSKTKEITVSYLNAPIMKIENAKNFKLEGLKFLGGLSNSIEVSGGEKVSIEKCEISLNGAYAVSIKEGLKHSIKNNHFYKLGAGGVHIKAGDRKNLIPCEHLVSNNHIHDYAQIKRVYAAAVNLNFPDGSTGVRVANNLIHHSPHVGILVSGNDNLIELNEIHNVCLFSNDMGGIYSWYDWTSHGNTIRYNYIHSSPKAHGIYFDDGDSGDHAYGNIINGVDYGFLIGGGRDNTVENNLVLNSRYGLVIDARGTQRNYTAKNRRLSGRLKEVKPAEGIWQQRFPTLQNYLNDSPELPHGNDIQNNVFFNCSKGIIKKANSEQLSKVTFKENILRNGSKLDIKQIPKTDNSIIDAIPIDKIGLHK